MIAILVPTRGRPEQLRRMINSANNRCAILIGCDENEFEEYSDVYKEFKQKRHAVFWHKFEKGTEFPTSYKWNKLAQWAAISPRTKLFMLGADDMVFETPGWNEILIEAYEKLENKIHCFSLKDSRGEDSHPHPIVTREWIEALGYFCNPMFLHWQQDRWTIEIAKANNCFTHLKDYSLLHIKPSDHGQADETHNRLRSFGWRERDAYTAEKMAHVLEGEKKRLAQAMNMCITGIHENTGVSQ